MLAKLQMLNRLQSRFAGYTSSLLSTYTNDSTCLRIFINYKVQ